LQALLKERDPEYKDLGNTGAKLADAIMTHRRIELWGEGFRWFDLKRLGLPLDRTGSNFDATCYPNPCTLDHVLSTRLANIPLLLRLDWNERKPRLRDPEYKDLGNTGAKLADEIMTHRRIELWGEGFRWFDCFLFWNLEDPAISIRILVQETTESSVKIRTGSIQWQT